MGWPAIIMAGAAVVGAAYQIYQGEKQKDLGKQQAALARQNAIEQARLLELQGLAASRMYNLQAGAIMAAAHATGKAAAAARALGEKNAALIIEQGEKAIAQKKKEHTQLEDTTRARMWASGTVASKGTQKGFRVTLRKENKAERAWMDKVFSQQADVAREGGEVNAKALKASVAGAGQAAAALKMQGVIALAEARAKAQQGLTLAGVAGRDQINAGNAAIFGGLVNLAGGIGGFGNAAGFGGGSGTTAGAGGTGLNPSITS